MNKQLEAIKAGRTPDGYVLNLDIQNMFYSRAWIEEHLETTNMVFRYSIRFQWMKDAKESELEIYHWFNENEFQGLYKCITDFKEFAARYL
jgi:hypothetical protein